MKMQEMICAVQKTLGIQVDGRAGPETWGAIYAHVVKPEIAGGPPAEAIEPVDPRSEKCIATLLPEVHPIARALVQKARQNGILVKVISGLSHHGRTRANSVGSPHVEKKKTELRFAGRGLP